MISYLLTLFGLKKNDKNNINDMGYRITEQETKRLSNPRGVDGILIYNHITKEMFNTFDLKKRPYENIQLKRLTSKLKKEGGSFLISPINYFGDNFIGFNGCNLTDFAIYCDENNINFFDSFSEVKNDSRQQSI